MFYRFPHFGSPHELGSRNEKGRSFSSFRRHSSPFWCAGQMCSYSFPGTHLPEGWGEIKGESVRMSVCCACVPRSMHVWLAVQGRSAPECLVVGGQAADAGQRGGSRERWARVCHRSVSENTQVCLSSHGHTRPFPMGQGVPPAWPKPQGGRRLWCPVSSALLGETATAGQAEPPAPRREVPGAPKATRRLPRRGWPAGSKESGETLAARGFEEAASQAPRDDR